MKILIAGYGEVGENLARELSDEGHDLTLMDSDPQVLNAGMNRYDVMAVQGNCASMDSLRRADVAGSNLLIACTGSDELNLLACMTAHAMNPSLHTIARIRTPDYLEQMYAMRDSFGISMTFNPEQQAAEEMERLLKFPGFLNRESFMGGRVEIVEFRVEAGSKLCNLPMKNLNSELKCQVLVCAVLRNGKSMIPDGRFTIYEGDRLFVTATSDALALMLKNLGIVTRRTRRVMIVGGGTTAYYLSQRLTTGRAPMSVSIIEEEEERCRELADLLPRATVIHGTPDDRELLESEGLSTSDAMVALTDSDETNIIASLYANSRGVPLNITGIGHADGSHFINTLPLGSVISPAKLSCNTIVRYVRAMQNQNGAATAIHTIADGQAEAIEFTVDADTLFSEVPFRKIKLRKNIRVVCISRGNTVEIPNGDSSFHVGDNVVVVVNGDSVVLQLNDIFA